MTFPSAMTDRDVCIIGLGYVGLTLAVAMADSGFRVHGLEVRDDVLAGLAAGKPHFWEPRLEEKLNRVVRQERFTFSKELDDRVDASVYIITVGTPLGADGTAQIGSVSHATEQVAGHLRDDALVVLRSTVKLGTARNVVKPILDATGKRYHLAVCPERTLEGRALIELHELPQIIGADSPDTRFRCAQLFHLMTPTTVAVTSLEAAELVKLVDNTFRDVSFAFANEVAKLCGQAGISAREVIRAGKLGYPRTNVALPGPVGGPCLEKDPHILAESARQWGVDMSITRAARATNELQPREAVAHLKTWSRSRDGFPIQPEIRLLGLAFKGVPPTDDLRGTMAKPILEALREAFPTGTFAGYDPVVASADIETFFAMPGLAGLEAAFDGADIVVIANNHPVFSNMDLAALARRMRRPGVIYDFWNMHDDVAVAMPPGIDSLALGSETLVRS